MSKSKPKLLWISKSVPYDMVPHAGGKIHNYYLKQLHKMDVFDINLISFCNSNVIEKVDLNKYNIKNNLIIYKKKGFYYYFWALINLETKLNIFNRYAGLTYNFEEYSIIKLLKKFKNNGYKPDIIILHWTQIILMKSIIQKMFPNAKYVAIEEDVSYLAYQRKKEFTKSIIKKFIWGIKYKKLKQIEIDKLNNSNLVILNNHKDKELLQKEELRTDIWVWSPYFQSMLNTKRTLKNKNLLFYGAMNREENWRSAIWFIENVFYKISDKETKLVIVGNDPNSILRKYESDRIIFLGFVENISKLFEESLCLIASLVLGAGVKIKVIEGLSSGIPVLTNSIGIEGINVDNEAFFYCETPNDYVNAIENLLSPNFEYRNLEKKAKEFIRKEYNYKYDSKIFCDKLVDLL